MSPLIVVCVAVAVSERAALMNASTKALREAAAMTRAETDNCCPFTGAAVPLPRQGIGIFEAVNGG